MGRTPDYSRYSLDELYDVYHHINKENYPERFNIIAGEIEKRKREQSTEAHKEIKAPKQQSKHEIIIKRLLIAYYFITCMIALSFVHAAVTHTDGLHEYALGLISLLMFILVCYGLHRRKTWMYPLIFIVSAYSIIIDSFYVFGRTMSDHGLSTKVFAFLLVVFFGYQILFFKKAEVKKLFSEKGETVI